MKELIKQSIKFAKEHKFTLSNESYDKLLNHLYGISQAEDKERHEIDVLLGTKSENLSWAIIALRSRLAQVEKENYKLNAKLNIQEGSVHQAVEKEDDPYSYSYGK